MSDNSNERYYYLKFNEIIKEGDECDVCADGWRDSPKWVPAGNTVGRKAPDPAYPSHRKYRRLNATATSSERVSISREDANSSRILHEARAITNRQFPQSEVTDAVIVESEKYEAELKAGLESGDE